LTWGDSLAEEVGAQFTRRRKFVFQKEKRRPKPSRTEGRRREKVKRLEIAVVNI